MAQQNSAPAISAGALTTPAPITPALTETFAQGCFGTQGMRMRIKTTGTLTNVTVLDPGTTPSSNPGTPAPLATPATGERELLVPLTAVNPATGLAQVNFSSITGVTYEIYRY
ncbi:MAG: hypothetical protein ABW046_20600 [Actinoplanes sp.]